MRNDGNGREGWSVIGWEGDETYAEQIPTPLRSAQHADEQSESSMHPPVMNCEASPAPTFLAPASLGARANAVMATVFTSQCEISSCDAGEWDELTSQDDGECNADHCD